MLDNRCENISEKLFDYIDGELTEDEVKSIEAHIGSCPECRAELGRCREVLRLLKASEYTPDKDLLDSVLKKNVKKRFSMLRFGTVAAAAAIAVVVFSNSGMFSRFFSAATADGAAENLAAPEAACDVGSIAIDDSDIAEAGNSTNGTILYSSVYSSSLADTVVKTEATQEQSGSGEDGEQKKTYAAAAPASTAAEAPESIKLTLTVPTHTSPLVTGGAVDQTNKIAQNISFNDLVSKYLPDYIDKPILLFCTHGTDAALPDGYETISDDTGDFTAYVYKYSNQLVQDIKRSLADAESNYTIYEMYEKCDTVIFINFNS